MPFTIGLPHYTAMLVVFQDPLEVSHEDNMRLIITEVGDIVLKALADFLISF